VYLEHFGLREPPFRLTPDTDFLYQHRAQLEALNVLLVGLRQGEGILKVTGEVGSGKTFLCRMLLNAIEEEFVTAYIPNPLLSPEALYHAVASELGIDGEKIGQSHHLYRLISERLIELNSEGRVVVLLVDEAQAMPEESLEALRLLTNLETEKAKLLQIVLFGQSELDDRIASESMRQLRQRISFSYNLYPLNRDDVYGYVAHRLTAAGYNGRPVFNEKACGLLHQASRGLPRLVNIYAHKAMMAAYGRGERQVGPRHVRAAVSDTDPQGIPLRTRVPVWIGVAAVTIPALILALFWFMERGGA
jgi:MSHA biogenesis protein MshM